MVPFWILAEQLTGSTTMDRRHRDILTINRNILIEKTENVELLLDELVHKGTITKDCAMTIKKKEKPAEQAKRLYNLLPNCGPWAFKELIDAFNVTGNDTVAYFLKENRVSNQSPTEGLSPVEESCDFFEEKYRMKSSPRGAVLLVNIFKYDHDWREQRDGSEKDMKELKTLFEDMGYSVHEEDRGTKEDIEETLIKWKENRSLTEVDCGIIILMAHGTEILSGSVIIETSDRKTIETEWIINLLSASEAPLLHGKPKLIFILTCRGKYPDFGTDMEKLKELQDAANQNTQLEAHMFDTNGRFEGFAPISPHMSDVLLIYPCAPGTASVRDTLQGSWFVQEMISVFRKKAHKDDVETMLKEMDRNLIKQRQAGAKSFFQTVCYTSRGFKRKLFLNPISSFTANTTNGNTSS